MYIQHKWHAWVYNLQMRNLPTVGYVYTLNNKRTNSDVQVKKKTSRFNNSDLCFQKPTFAARALSTFCMAYKQKQRQELLKLKGNDSRYQQDGKKRKTAYSWANKWSNHTISAPKEDLLQEGQRVEDEKKPSMALSICLNGYISCHIFTKQRIHCSHVNGFCSMLRFMCRHSFSCPCLVDQGFTAFPSDFLSDVLPLAQYTCILPHRSKARKEFIKRNYSKKERGEDIRDVVLNKWDGYPILVESTSKGKKRGTMSVQFGKTIQISKYKLV